MGRLYQREKIFEMSQDHGNDGFSLPNKEGLKNFATSTVVSALESASGLSAAGRAAFGVQAEQNTTPDTNNVLSGNSPIAKELSSGFGKAENYLSSKAEEIKKSDSYKPELNTIEGKDGKYDWSKLKNTNVILGELSNVVGSMLPTIAAAYVTRGKSLPANFATTAGVEAAMEKGSAVQDYEKSIARQRGIEVSQLSPEDKALANSASTGYGMIAGSLGSILPTKFIQGAFGKKAAETLMKRIFINAPIKALQDMTIEGSTEGMQQFSQNVIAKLNKIDPNRPLSDGVIDSIIGGALGGGVAGAAEGLSNGNQTPVAPITGENKQLELPAPTKDVPFTDTQNPKAEEVFAKTIQSLPEKTVNVAAEGLARPMPAESIASLSKEELMHVGIALNAAKEIPGANIEAIDSNIHLIESTGVKVPTIATSVQEDKKTVAKPELEQKIVEKPVAEAKKPEVVTEKKIDTTIEEKKNVPDKVPIFKGKDIAKDAEQLGSDQGGLSDYTLDKIKSENFVNDTVSISELRKNDKDLDQYLNEKQDVREYEGDPFGMSPIVSSNGEVVDGYNRIHQSIIDGKTEIEVYRGVAKEEKQKSFPRFEPTEKEIAEGYVESTGEGSSVTRNGFAEKANEYANEYANKNTKDGENFNENFEKAREEYIKKYSKNNKTKKEKVRTKEILSKITDQQIENVFRKEYVRNKILEISNTVNPALRKRLSFAIVREIIDDYGNVSLGQYNRSEGRIDISIAKTSEKNLENTIIHEIMHNAWDFFERKERAVIMDYVNSMSLQEKRDVFGKNDSGEWVYDIYEKKYKSKNMLLAEEIVVTQSANSHETNPVIVAFRDVVSSIIKLIHRVTGLLDKQYKGIKARELFRGIFDEENPMFTNSWRMATNEVLYKVKKQSDDWKGKLPEKAIKKVTAPINIDTNVTSKNNLRTQQIFNSAWRKLYKEEAPGKFTDLLVKKEYSDVAVKAGEIAFASGKRVGREKAAVKSREEKQAIREKSAAKIKEIRSSLRVMFKEKTATAQEIKAKVIEYVKENLPKNMHGKYLVAVKNAKTSVYLKKVITSVDERRAKYERSILVKSITEVADNIQNLPVDIQRTIIEITSEIELKKHTKRLLQRLNSTKEYLDTKENDHEMPRRVLNELGILERTPFEKLSTQQLIDINNRLQQYNNVGRNIMKDKAVLAKKTLEENLADIEKGSQNMDKVSPEDRLNTFVKDNLENPDDITSFKDKAREFFSMDKDKFVRLRLSMMGMDRLFNVLDGRADYKGVNYNTFKVPVDEAHNQWQYAEDKIKRSFYNTINELKLTEKNSKRIAIYAYMQQRGGTKKLIEDHGYTKKQLEAIKLTDREMAMYKFMRNHLDDLHASLTEKMAKENNVNLGKQENYFPMMTNYGVTKPLLEELEQMGRMKSVVFGATQERKENAHQVLKLDAFQVFDSYVGKSTYFIAMDSTIQKLNKIASSEKYRKAVGENAQRSVLTWLDVLARKGGSVKKEARWEEKMNEFNNNLSVVMLGLRITTIVKQPLALLDGAAEIGAYAFSGTRMILDEKWRDFIRENSSEMRNRAGGDPAFMEISHDKVLPKIKDKAMAPIKFLDQYTAGAVWAGAYTKKMDELGEVVDFNNVNSDAIKYADLVVRKTQASGSFKDLPLALTNEYRTASKLIFKFQTFVLNRWSYISEDLPDKIKNNKPLAVQQISFLMLSMIAEAGVTNIYQGIMGSGGGDDDKDNMFVKAIKNIISSILQTVPLLGQAISSTRYGSNPLPLVEIINKFFDSLKQVSSAKKASTKTKHSIRSMSYIIGTYYGIPTEQARQLLEKSLFGK